MKLELAEKSQIRVFLAFGLLVCAILLLPTNLTSLSYQGVYCGGGAYNHCTARGLAQSASLSDQHTHQATHLRIQNVGDTGSRLENNPISHLQQESSQTPKKNLSTRERLHLIIEQVATKYDVDPALIKAIIMAESGYNPRAVSKKGAIGLMQLMPSTARELGVKELFDPEDNVEAGVRYFKRLLCRFGGDVRLALAAYNAGSSKVRRYRGVPPIGATRYYVKKVFHYYRLYKKNSMTRTDDA